MSQRAFRALTAHNAPESAAGIGEHRAYDAAGNDTRCYCATFPWPDFPAGHDIETGEVLSVPQIVARRDASGWWGDNIVHGDVTS